MYLRKKIVYYLHDYLQQVTIVGKATSYPTIGTSGAWLLETKVEDSILKEGG